MATKPWREIAIPHEDVLKGSFQQAEFAADISRVHDGTATSEYQDPVLFFKRTFITEGMRLLLNSVVKRLVGKGGDPVIQLQTAFGGGKTHTMLAVYHMAGGVVDPHSLPGIAEILDKAQVAQLPKAKVVVLDGVKASPSQPKKRGKISVHTLWGELAWQLGGEKGYELVKEADIAGTNPGKETLATLIRQYAPCVILIDELVAYMRQFEEGRSYTGGTFDSNLTSIQALTEAMKAVPTAVLLASLPESAKEAGSQRGQMALQSLEHYFARVQALWKPVATEEAFEIVRRRLFNDIKNFKAVESTCRTFADYYIKDAASFPQETQESRYLQRMISAYPIHPEVFDRLYDDWSTLDNFQRTRGVLKFMAKVIHRLWNDNNQDLLIQPGNIPLYDLDVRNEMICYLPQGWDPVLEGDIDGPTAETADIEKEDPRFGSVQACRRVARTIFLGSAPSNTSQRVRGIQEKRVVLGCAQPEQVAELFKDALRRLTDRLHYLNSATDRYWFDTRANLRREMEERKRRFNEKEHEEVYPIVKACLQKILSGDLFEGVHVFTPAGDVPDDAGLRLVVLPPDAGFSRNLSKIAIDKATEILKFRGDQPRQRQNRLIFLVPDQQSVGRLLDQVKVMLAWQSIVDDVKEMRLNLDQLQARQAGNAFNEASAAILRMVRETYKWLLVPTQDVGTDGSISELKWETKTVNTGGASTINEIQRALKDDELVIFEWAPMHLANILRKWFWKRDVHDVGAMDIWNKTCCYLYLPRLCNEGVYKNALLAGAASRDFFAFAYGKIGERYSGFTFGAHTILVCDSLLLIIDPAFAVTIEAQYQQPTVDTSASTGGQVTVDDTEPAGAKQGSGDGSAGTSKSSQKKRFFGTIELDPVKAKYQFSQIADEVLEPFTTQPDARVTISVEIHADSAKGFNESTQRIVRENSKTLKFKNAGFEES
jgi:uncharacterized protein